jgi:Tol biopolymer transport system component
VLRSGALGSGPGDEKERDLSWLDWSNVGDLSRDGKTILFTESGEGGGAGYSVYTRNVDGSPAVRLGEGNGLSFSPDGKSALAMVRTAADPQLVLLPVGAGEPRPLSREKVQLRSAAFLPDGKRIVFGASEPGHGERIYVRGVFEGGSRPVSPEGYRGFFRAISPDGRLLPVRGPDRRFYLYPLDGGEPTPLAGMSGTDNASGWTADGRLIVWSRGDVPLKVFFLDTRTGNREFWRTFMPGDSAGVADVGPVFATPDRKTYVYTYARILSDLYLVEGLK